MRVRNFGHREIGKHAKGSKKILMIVSDPLIKICLQETRNCNAFLPLSRETGGSSNRKIIIRRFLQLHLICTKACSRAFLAYSHRVSGNHHPSFFSAFFFYFFFFFLYPFSPCGFYAMCHTRVRACSLSLLAWPCVQIAFRCVHRGLNDIALFRIERQMAFSSFNPPSFLISRALFTPHARYSPTVNRWNASLPFFAIFERLVYSRGPFFASLNTPYLGHFIFIQRLHASKLIVNSFCPYTSGFSNWTLKLK